MSLLPFGTEFQQGKKVPNRSMRPIGLVGFRVIASLPALPRTSVQHDRSRFEVGARRKPVTSLLGLMQLPCDFWGFADQFHRSAIPPKYPHTFVQGSILRIGNRQPTRFESF